MYAAKSLGDLLTEEADLEARVKHWTREQSQATTTLRHATDNLIECRLMLKQRLTEHAVRLEAK